MCQWDSFITRRWCDCHSRAFLSLGLIAGAAHDRKHRGAIPINQACLCELVASEQRNDSPVIPCEVEESLIVSLIPSASSAIHLSTMARRYDCRDRGSCRSLESRWRDRAERV